MDLYNPLEIERIDKLSETNDRLEDFFTNKREQWNKELEPIFEVLQIANDLEDPKNPTKILDAQAFSLTFKQKLNEENKLFMNKRSRESVKIKKIKYDKLIFYATGFGVKTNLTEKGLLIDAHLAQNERTIEIIDSYLSFLMESIKNLESLGYAIKNMIELLGYLRR